MTSFFMYRRRIENSDNSEIPDFGVHEKYTDRLKHKIIALKTGIIGTKSHQK